MLFGANRHGRTSETPLALLDIGSSKVACLIVSAPSRSAAEAQIGEPLGVRQLGLGMTRSRGIRGGAVADFAEAEEAIKQAVGEAEAEAGVSVDDVVVAVTGGRLHSANFAGSAVTTSGTVAGSDIAKVLDAGKAYVEQNGRSLLHLHRLGYRIDGQGGIRNPRGQPGHKLSIDLNAVAADTLVTRNIAALLGRSYLTVSHLVAAPYASALAVLTVEDLRDGAVVIDLGACTTTFAIFGNGLFTHAGSIALGGQHITHDIAQAFAIPVNQAERIKALYGNLVGAMSDEHEFLPSTGNSGETTGELSVTRAQLRRVIAPRVDETLQLVRDRVLASGLCPDGLRRVVLTGGASQLAGLVEAAERHFGCSVRTGSPKLVAGMPKALATPVLGAVIGLGYAVLVPGALPQFSQAQKSLPAGYAGRLGQWFKDSFWDDERPAGAA